MSIPHGHHYGLTEEDMAVVLEEIEKRLAIRSYVEVAIAIGKPLSGTRKLMQEIMRERRAGIIRDHRGTRRRRVEVSCDLGCSTLGVGPLEPGDIS